MNKNNVLSKLFHRYFIVALNGMALGLFCTLIIGLIIKQIAINLSGSLSSFLLVIASIAMALTGPVIGIGVAHALKTPKLVILASGVVGFLGAFGSNLGTNNLLDHGKLIFLYKINDGPIEKSYGIHVAQLAHLPEEVIVVANNILKELDKKIRKIEF